MTNGERAGLRETGDMADVRVIWFVLLGSWLSCTANFFYFGGIPCINNLFISMDRFIGAVAAGESEWFCLE